MYMSFIASILYPVDFSPSCVATAVYVKREQRFCLEPRFHWFMLSILPATTAYKLYVRPISEFLAEHVSIGQERLDSFLSAEFPVVV
jgi:hypothetical protein